MSMDLLWSVEHIEKNHEKFMLDRRIFCTNKRLSKHFCFKINKFQDKSLICSKGCKLKVT